MVDINAKCKNCNVDLSGAIQISGKTSEFPTPGTLSICFKCGALGIYTERNEIELLTEEHLQEIKSICENSYNKLLDAQRIVKERRREH